MKENPFPLVLTGVHFKTKNQTVLFLTGGVIRAKANNNQKKNRTISMKKCFSRGFALAAIAGLILTSHAQDTNSIDQSQFPTILLQPVDQCVLMGTPVTFSVQATNADGYQWYVNNNPIDGQTNGSLTIANASTNDVGYYTASVIKGSEAVPSRQALLNVYITSGLTSAVTTTVSNTLGSVTRLASRTFSALDLGGGGMITVFGTPIVSGGGSGQCPGPYSGYVNFTKTMSDGWGYAPTSGTTTHTAADPNRSDTKVQYVGYYGDFNCDQTTVTVPDPAISPKYTDSRFIFREACKSRQIRIR